MSTELNSLISSFKHLQLKDNPRVETITFYEPFYDKYGMASKDYMIMRVIEINDNYAPPKHIVKSICNKKLGKFRPVFPPNHYSE